MASSATAINNTFSTSGSSTTGNLTTTTSTQWALVLLSCTGGDLTYTLSGFTGTHLGATGVTCIFVPYSSVLAITANGSGATWNAVGMLFDFTPF